MKSSTGDIHHYKKFWVGLPMSMVDSFEDPTIRPVHPSLLDDGGFKEDIQARMTATQEFAEEIAKRRLERAQRSGTRRIVDYVPGDLVYYWRNQVPLKGKTTQSVGRFLGPARVLATETRKDLEGNLRPGSIVWLHRAGRLLRAAPEQLSDPHQVMNNSWKP